MPRAHRNILTEPCSFRPAMLGYTLSSTEAAMFENAHMPFMVVAGSVLSVQPKPEGQSPYHLFLDIFHACSMLFGRC